MDERYVVFVGEARPDSVTLLPTGYRSTIWRPSLRRLVPPGDPLPRLYVWWLMHQLHGFRNRLYAALIVYGGDAVVAHRSIVFPPYFAFPFMGSDDVQIGLVTTAPDHRGRGLAVFAIREIVRRLGRPGRRFWYLTDVSNEASVRAASAAGLVAAGEALHERRLGSRRLGAYRLAPADVAPAR